MVTRTRILALPIVLLAAAGAPAPARAPQAPPRVLPPMLERYLAEVVQPTPTERAQMLGGRAVTKLLTADESKEVAVFGAVWIDAPITRYLDAVRDIESFERGGGFVVTKRLSDPPRLEDFAAMHLPAEDVADLRTCRVGDCEVKLSERALRRFQTEINWKGPNVQAAADALMREILLEYVKGYLEGGNERLAVYRDQSRPTFVPQEFRTMVEGTPAANYMPDLRQYLLDYPSATLPNSTSFLYWQETRFGLKPTIRVSHLTIAETSGGAVVASKMLYASHYFWTGLEVRTLVPDPSRGRGFWFVTVNRGRSDGLGGFTGRLIRGRVRSESQKGSLAALEATKKRLEG
ncbi:MAG: hypothetical protein H6Q10_492 [Acidobacteria bacterium]|nr:hypothetical protein [Acidobacteriota bacterium]